MTNWRFAVMFIVTILWSGQKWKVACRNMIMGETLLVPLSTTQKANCECGKFTRKVDDERLARVKIAGGRIPWLAELVTSFDNFDYDGDEFRLCFGVVVTLQTVLFPASCIDSNARHKPKVKLLGVDNRKDAVREITNVLVHPNYRRKNDNDIALIKLKNAIDFNQTKVVPICLPKTSKRYPIKYPHGDGNNLTSIKVWHDNTGFADSTEEDSNRMRPCRNPNPPCEKRPCPPCPTTRPPNRVVKPKPPQFVLANSVTRTWFYRKGPGYDYNQFFGRFDVQTVNASRCTTLFPEMLQSKVTCLLQKENRDIVKQNAKFFTQLELGMPFMLSNTTLVKGKPQAATTKYYLEGIRAPGSSGGIPLLEARENVIALLRTEDYVPWILENSNNAHVCET